MDVSVFTRLVRRTHPMQGLRLRFDRQTGMIGLSRLNVLCESRPDIRIDEHDKIVVSAILMSQDWGNDRNRTIGVYGLCAVDEKNLFEIGRDVENLELSGEHGAQGIMAKRRMARDEAVHKIIIDVLSSDITNLMDDWGLLITGEFVEYLETPAIQFMICKPDGEMIFRVILDGWTGRFGIDGNVDNGPDELYVQPKQIQDFIRASLDQRLEELTAAA